jgi:SAM-dependent methyltransferase
MNGAHLYDNPRVAAAYAYARPAVHVPVVARVRERLSFHRPVERALDLGCGAGRSTAALAPVARAVVGIDPAVAMLEHRRSVAPGATFVVGRAERLPFQDATFDLVTAAGSINYADRTLALPEVARVLDDDGVFVIYDFSDGRRLSGSRRLEDWFAELERRYPSAPGYQLDVTALPFENAGLRLNSYDAFEVAVPMTLDSYLRYVMSETRVELAVSRGDREADIREWGRLTLEEIFDDEPRDVMFDAYAAIISKLAAGNPARLAT